MSREYRTVDYRDELLADHSVQRRYADGRTEWRRREGTRVRWRDDSGLRGVDEPLGDRLVKRRIEGDRVLYGRELGYGRTAWSNWVLTVNRTSAGGRVGAVLAAAGAAGLLPAVVDPPQVLTPEQEEELRRQSAEQQSSGGGGGDSAAGDDGSHDGRDDDWSDPGSGSDDDFG